MRQPNDAEPGGILTARFHLYAIIGSLCFTVAFCLITRGTLQVNTFLFSFIFMMIQVELFAWIGSIIFKKLVYHSVKEFIRKVFIRLAFFYVVVVIIAGILFILVSAALSIGQGVSPKQFFEQLPERELRGFIIGSSFGLLIGTVIYFFLELIDVINREQKLLGEKMKYHYETLINQMNPHFLFNSLNTLSSIIYKDVNLADRFIVKLSSVYRYILDQHESKMVNLENELNFVKDYFYLQQLRDEDRIHLEINIDQPSKYQILPVSLQLLVENVLKHNAATNDRPLLISISVTGNLFIKVENNLQPKQQLELSSQIGLKNLSERIRIITGKELQIEQSNDHFCVRIPIALI